MDLARDVGRRAVLAAVVLGVFGLLMGCEDETEPPKKEFLVVVSVDDSGEEYSVTSYRVGSDGSLSEKEPLVLDDAEAITDIAAHPEAPYAYLADEGAGLIHAIALTKSGNPKLTPGSPFDLDTSLPNYLDVSASGGYLAFTAETAGDENLHTYVIDPSDGDLVIQETAVAIDIQASSVTRHPDEPYLYVTNSSTNEVSAYELDDEGQPTLDDARTVASGASPLSAAVDGDGHNLFVVEDGNNQVAVFPLGNSGNLEARSDLKATGGGPLFAAASPGGTLLYVTNSEDGTISAFMVDRGDGVLDEVASSPLITEASPAGIVFAAKGSLLYVSHYTEKLISGYTVDSATGALTALLEFPLDTETSPLWMVIVKR